MKVYKQRNEERKTKERKREISSIKERAKKKEKSV